LKSTENLNQEPATHQKDSAGVEALASHTPLGITPAVDPLQSLTDTSRKQPATDTAPAAAAWLHNPASIEKRKTCAQLLIEDLEKNGEWTGADQCLKRIGPLENY
jgi:hypothetical protein